MDGDAGRASKAPRSSSTSPSNPAIAEERGEKDDDKNDLHKCLKTALLSVVIVIVVLVLLLPTIVFFLPLPTPVCCYSSHYAPINGMPHLPLLGTTAGIDRVFVSQFLPHPWGAPGQ